MTDINVEQPPPYSVAVNCPTHYPPPPPTVPPASATPTVHPKPQARQYNPRSRFGPLICPECQASNWKQTHDCCTIVIVLIGVLIFFPFGILYLFMLGSLSARLICRNCKYRCFGQLELSI
uniref:Brain protein I3 n=1 Tax=Plectus sambesii TaxID=2011161 RepID=A0A914X2N8_9BILA